MLCACGCGAEVSPGKTYRKGHARKGKKSSPEHRAKISRALKGRKTGRASWNKGLDGDPRCAHRLETKKKIAESMKKKIASGYEPDTSGTRTEEAREKRREALKGRVVSVSTRSRIGRALSGKQNGMHGRSHTLEARGVIAEASRCMWADPEKRAELEKKLNSVENRQRLRDAAYKQGRHLVDSKPERIFSDLLEEARILFDRGVVLTGSWGKYACDFLVPPNTVVEVDGVYWHSFPWGRPVDRRRTDRLEHEGYIVRRVWEYEVPWFVSSDIDLFLRTGEKPAGVVSASWVKKIRRAMKVAEDRGHRADRFLDHLAEDETYYEKLLSLGL